MVRGGSGLWHDVLCSKQFRAVCQVAASASAAASSCTTPAPAPAPATTFAPPETEECEGGWLHAGARCYRRFPSQVCSEAGGWRLEADYCVPLQVSWEEARQLC